MIPAVLHSEVETGSSSTFEHPRQVPESTLRQGCGRYGGLVTHLSADGEGEPVQLQRPDQQFHSYPKTSELVGELLMELQLSLTVSDPWLQIQLLRILGLLGKGDPRTSELMYDVLGRVFKRRAEINPGNITVWNISDNFTQYTLNRSAGEGCQIAIEEIYPVSKINLKYLGLKALTYIVQQDPSLALQHQMAIMNAWITPDPIIKKERLWNFCIGLPAGRDVTVLRPEDATTT
uniref:Uncharacterized protein n=1 Tax=Sphaerodactylus townsendi TaxID=933632 RepID=A0ACB8E5S2_9SAUR